MSFEEGELLLNAPSADVSIDVRSQIISRHREKTVPFYLWLYWEILACSIWLGQAVFCIFYLIDYFVVVYALLMLLTSGLDEEYTADEAKFARQFHQRAKI